MARTQVNGVTLVATAAIIAVMGAYAISSFDSADVAVVSYQELEDVTDLFSFTDEPQFLEYASSKNCTGYYTDSLKKYWDGVDYTESTRANNYKLNIHPVVDSSGTLAVSGNTLASMSVKIASGDATYTVTQPRYAGLSSVMSSITTDARYISFLSVDDYDFDDWSDSSPDWVLFITNTLSSNYTYTFTQYDGASAVTATTAAIACIYDSNTGTCNLFADLDCQVPVAIGVQRDYVAVISSTQGQTVDLGDSCTYTCYDVSTKYLDPTDGVSIA